MKDSKKVIKQLEKLEIKKEEQKELKGGARVIFGSIYNCW